LTLIITFGYNGLQILWNRSRQKQHQQSESITFRLDSIILNKIHHETEQRR